MLQLSFADTKCLSITANRNLTDLLVSTLGHVGISNVDKASDMNFALHHISSAECDLIVCAGLPEEDYYSILSAVRNHTSSVACRVPVICVAENWTSEEIAKLRDAGVTLLSTFPLTMRNLLKQVTRALNETREFITISSYRGPCRRRTEIPNFAGPFRRAADATKKSGAPQAAPKSAPKSAPANTAAKPNAKQASQPQKPSFVAPPPPSYSSSHKDEVSNDPIQHQTDHAVNAAIVTAEYVCTLFEKLTKAAGGRIKPDAMQFVAGHLDRWINLMSVVGSRIESYGCTTKQLESIKNMRQSFRVHVFTYAEVLTLELVEDCEKLIKNSGTIPISTGEVMLHRVTSIDDLILSLGDSENMSETLAEGIAKAHNLVQELVNNESGAVVLPEFELQSGRS